VAWHPVLYQKKLCAPRASRDCAIPADATSSGCANALYFVPTVSMCAMFLDNYDAMDEGLLSIGGNFGLLAATRIGNTYLPK